MTQTDTEWNSRLAAILGDDFADNGSASFNNIANSVVPALMNRIGLTVVNDADDPANPFIDYDKPMMEMGDVVQMVKVKYTKPGEYDPEDTNPFAIKKGEAIAQYFTQNDSVQYSQTIWDRELRRAFAQRDSFDRFVTAQIDAMEKSNTLDKRTKWKKILTDSPAIKNDPSSITLTNGVADGTVLLDKFRSYANDVFREPSESYNIAGDTAISSEIDIIMRRKDKIAIDKTLAGVYNMDKLDLEANIKLVDDFATPTGDNAGKTLLAVIVDRRALGYYPTQITPSAQYNAKGLYTNYFQTIEGVYTVDKTRNAIRIYGE